MTAGSSDSPAPPITPSLPPRFVEALTSVRRAPRPRDLALEEVPAPRRLAPYAAALSADTLEDPALATGRLVILHDPQGQDAWQGDFRLVLQVTARLEPELATDPALSQAAWSWLTDALDGAGAGYHNLVGTVTTVQSETFGGLELTDSCAHAEVRASWTPVSPDLAPHLAAWYTLVHVAAGHEPQAATALTVAGR